MSRAVVVLSGGQDSTTILYHTLGLGYNEVHTVTIDYGQRHKAELDAARCVKSLAERDYGRLIPWEVIEVEDVLKGTSPLVSDTDLEQYDHHSLLPGGIEKTFVPMRNLLFLTLAANRAYVLGGADCIVIGVSQEDYGGYPDCRDSFLYAVEQTLNTGAFTGEDGTPPNILIAAPLLRKTKAETVRLARDLGECYGALAFSHTAYDGEYPPDGSDHASLLRAKGFEEAGLPDPLVVRAVMENKMNLPKTSNYDDARNGVRGAMAYLMNYIPEATEYVYGSPLP